MVFHSGKVAAITMMLFDVGLMSQILCMFGAIRFSSLKSNSLRDPKKNSINKRPNSITN